MTDTDKITHVAINCQVLLFRLSNSIAEGYYKTGLKQMAKNFQNELVKVEKNYFDKFFNKSEESTKVVYEVYDTFMQTVANVPIYDMENVTKILEAYDKDPKSIEGIVKKINKSHD
jgi:hypothetical protein